MKNLNENELRDLYLNKELNPYEIGKLLECDHKTIRKYLKVYNIPMRSASEYNYIPRRSHTNPIKGEYMIPSSIAAHVAYLCEGWHTEKTDMLQFCNTDPNLIDLFTNCLTNVYKVNKYRLVIMSNSKEECDHLLKLYPNASQYIEAGRKTPLVRVICGGKTIARDFIKNAYSILEMVGGEGVEPSDTRF